MGALDWKSLAAPSRLGNDVRQNVEKAPGATGAFSIFSDGSGLTMIWSRQKSRPLAIDGKTIGFRTPDAARKFAAILNDVHRSQTMRKSGIDNLSRRPAEQCNLEGLERPVLIG